MPAGSSCTPPTGPATAAWSLTIAWRSPRVWTCLKPSPTAAGPARGFLALGYAGWGPGQLDQEMQDNAWLSAPASVDLMFDREHGPSGAAPWRS